MKRARLVIGAVLAMVFCALGIGPTWAVEPGDQVDCTQSSHQRIVYESEVVGPGLLKPPPDPSDEGDIWFYLLVPLALGEDVCDVYNDSGGGIEVYRSWELYGSDPAGRGVDVGTFRLYRGGYVQIGGGPPTSMPPPCGGDCFVSLAASSVTVAGVDGPAGYAVVMLLLLTSMTVGLQTVLVARSR
jgi:hypothetical protein